MQKKTTYDDIHFNAQNNPDFFDSLHQSVLEEIETFSIGKLRAICQRNGIYAGKMRRKELMFHVKQIFETQNAPLHLDTGSIINDLTAAVDEYKKTGKKE